jgi:hypothetical protein
LDSSRFLCNRLKLKRLQGEIIKHKKIGGGVNRPRPKKGGKNEKYSHFLHCLFYLIGIKKYRFKY